MRPESVSVAAVSVTGGRGGGCRAGARASAGCGARAGGLFVSMLLVMAEVVLVLVDPFIYTARLSRKSGRQLQNCFHKQ